MLSETAADAHASELSVWVMVLAHQGDTSRAIIMGTPCSRNIGADAYGYGCCCSILPLDFTGDEGFKIPSRTVSGLSQMINSSYFICFTSLVLYRPRFVVTVKKHVNQFYLWGSMLLEFDFRTEAALWIHRTSKCLHSGKKIEKFQFF